MRLSRLLAVILLLAACGGPTRQTSAPPTAAVASGAAPSAGIVVTSTAFAEGAGIPRRYTCDGENVSPPLSWTGVPSGAKGLALIADDPDAPAGTWTHWVIFNLPASSTDLPEGVRQEESPQGAVQGTTSFRKAGYGGPCPPSGTHRYYFRLYALDAPLSLNSSATAKDVQTAMEGHVLGEGTLMGRYGR